VYCIIQFLKPQSRPISNHRRSPSPWSGYRSTPRCCWPCSWSGPRSRPRWTATAWTTARRTRSWKRPSRCCKTRWPADKAVAPVAWAPCSSRSCRPRAPSPVWDRSFPVWRPPRVPSTRRWSASSSACSPAVRLLTNLRPATTTGPAWTGALWSTWLPVSPSLRFRYYISSIYMYILKHYAQYREHRIFHCTYYK